MNNEHVAEYWEIKDNNIIECGLCPHYCNIKENQSGKCGVRINRNGVLIAASYGYVTSIALDPIEKKPLYMFHPGKKIVSIGGYGCNLNCPFCQNYTISMKYDGTKVEYLTPEVVVEAAKQAIPDGNIGIAYTYNEPLIGYGYIKDCSILTKKAGLMNVLVTNGYINKAPLDELLPNIDALNIDMKGISERTYKEVGGTPDVVKNTIMTANQVCHVEVTTLVIPDENEDEVEEIAKWLSEVDPKIPYHLSRFFPRYKYSDRKPTPSETMYRLYDIAKRYLTNVYLGNM